MELEAEYLEGLKLMALWQNCQVTDILKQVAATNPPDFYIALRWHVFRFFVGRQYRGKRYWQHKQNASIRTRHYVKRP